jgi:hypothetical protein
MRDPWLFWTGLALAPFAGACFWVAMRVTSRRASLTWEITTQVIAGTGALLIGYESAFRTTAKDNLELKANTAVGLVLFTWGTMLLVSAVVKAFEK